MFGLIAAVMALAVPASGAGLADKIERGVSDEVLESGLVAMWYDAFVAPDGTIEQCTVRGAIGDSAAARQVCATIVGRKATPALGTDARPTYGTFVGALNFADNLERVPEDGVPPDMIIAAQGLPAGKPTRVGVTVAVGADGTVLECDPGPGSILLSRAACEQVRAAALPVRKAKSGAAVGYLSPMIVQFEAG